MLPDLFEPKAVRASLKHDRPVDQRSGASKTKMGGGNESFIRVHSCPFAVRFTPFYCGLRTRVERGRFAFSKNGGVLVSTEGLITGSHAEDDSLASLKIGSKIKRQSRTGSRGLIDRDVPGRTPAKAGSDDSRLVRRRGDRARGRDLFRGRKGESYAPVHLAHLIKIG